MDRCVYLLLLLGLTGVGWGQVNSEEKSKTPPAEAVLFEALPVVEAASLQSQSLMEAPASVTIITADQIRRRGYRTMADALAGQRGFFVSYDRIYRYVGVRGFSIPGDLNTRFLMMINGHSLTENVYGAAGYFGEDFGLDMDLIERIEIIRGPSSALYGTNGMFATVNIVTKSPVEYGPFRAAVETGSLGERKVQFSTSQYLGRGANLLVSASVFNNSGTDLYFPQFDSPETNNGWARNVDGEKGYHTFANLIWRGWSFLAYFNSREKQIPTGAWGSIFGDRGAKMQDGRGFVESAYRRNVGAEGQIRWRVYYDQYRSANHVNFSSEIGVLDARQGGKGDWLGTQFTYRLRVPRLGFLTVGSEAKVDVRSSMYAYYKSPLYLPLQEFDHPDRSAAAFFQQEVELSRHWKAYLGGRLDGSRYNDLSLTPRVGLIYQPSDQSAVKLLYGRAFRNASAFEQFYEDGVTQFANPGIDYERMQTTEAVFEHRVGRKLELSANVYHYRLNNLITAVALENGAQQYRNTAMVKSTGFELEASGPVFGRLKADASLAVQRSDYSREGYEAINSPARVGKVLLEGPVFGDRWWWSASLQYLSERRTFLTGSVPAVYLVNASLVSRRLPKDVEVEFGIHNLLNRKYWDPVGVAQGNKQEQDGCSVFVRLAWGPRSLKHEGRAASGKATEASEHFEP